MGKIRPLQGSLVESVLIRLRNGTSGTGHCHFKTRVALTESKGAIDGTKGFAVHSKRYSTFFFVLERGGKHGIL